jgi:23S rRNA (guanosine2251-2'-O)-methyltransferase
VRGPPRGKHEARRESHPRREAPPRHETAPRRDEGESGRYIYGVNPVLETLRGRPEAVEGLWLAQGQGGEPELRASAAAEILTRAREAGVRVQKVPRERLHALAQGGVHQGIVAEVRAFAYAELEDVLAAAKASDRPPLLVVLDGIQDPQNLGAIIRSAHALGAHGVVVAKDRAAGLTGAVAKASAGALAHTPVARVVNLSRALEQMKEAGFWTVAADPDGKDTAWQARLDGPLAVVVGAEGPGIRKGVLDHCDLRVRIPLAGQVASLNASVSAALLLYEICRQRAS